MVEKLSNLPEHSNLTAKNFKLFFHLIRRIRCPLRLGFIGQRPSRVAILHALSDMLRFQSIKTLFSVLGFPNEHGALLSFPGGDLRS